MSIHGHKVLCPKGPSKAVAGMEQSFHFLNLCSAYTDQNYELY